MTKARSSEVTGNRGQHEVTVSEFREAPLWPRLGIYTVAPADDMEVLRRLIEKAEDGQTFTGFDRNALLSFLRRLALNPSALAALNSRPKGRPASERER